MCAGETVSKMDTKHEINQGNVFERTKYCQKREIIACTGTYTQIHVSTLENHDWKKYKNTAHMLKQKHKPMTKRGKTKDK